MEVVSGAATYGIGAGFGAVGGSATNFGGKLWYEAGRAAVHGYSNTMIGAAFGQTPSLSSFAAASLGSLAGSGTSSFGSGIQIAGSTLAGGIGAELTGGDFWRGAAVGATVAGLNHLHTSYRSYRLKQYDGSNHPGKLNLKNMGRNKIATHLLKGIKYHMVSGTDIDLNELFDCLSTECLGIGGSHLLSRSNQHAITSFLGPTGDLFASVLMGDRRVKMMYEIPIHGPKQGLVFSPYKYTDATTSNGNWAIRWGAYTGLYLNFKNHGAFMKNWILGR